MKKIKSRIIDEIKKREYNKEYVKFCAIADLEKIKGKELYIIYDDILPDMYVNIKTDNKFADAIDYDIYADRLKRVRIVFPNGDIQYSYINKVDKESRNDELYTLTWEVPKVSILWHGLDIYISIIELIERDVKVYVEDYEF